MKEYDDELSILYNSADFINNYSKDDRIALITHFDLQPDYTLAAKQLAWCITYHRMPKELAIIVLRKFYESIYSDPKQVQQQIGIAVHKNMKTDQQIGIPPYPSLGV